MAEQTLHAYLKQLSPQTAFHPQQLVRRVALATVGLLKTNAGKLRRWSRVLTTSR